jgi:hypothetical protein
MRIDRKFSRSHPKNYMLVQYEELVLNPKETTMKICSFLSIPWDVSMLHPPKSDSSFIDPREVVKSVDRGTGIDVAALERWREHMKLWMNLAFRFYGSIFYPKALERFGYLDKRSG